MYTLVLEPQTALQSMVPFDVNDADIANAVDYGRAARNDPAQRQRDDAAYHKVMELGVVPTAEFHDRPWRIECGSRVVACNADVRV